MSIGQIAAMPTSSRTSSGERSTLLGTGWSVRPHRDEHDRAGRHARERASSWICGHGGTIYAAAKRVEWPGRPRWS